VSLFALGLNHDTAPLAVREKLAFPAESLSPALRALLQVDGVTEAALLSTCNRTELYCMAPAMAPALAWLAESRGLPLDQVRPYLYLLEGEAAVRHVFRVASGLDSMVLGETQIVGQIKDALDVANAVGGLGTTLNGLFQRAFSVAKDVRTQTAIGAHSVSMAAAAVRLAERLFPRWDELAVLFIGAGEMIDLCATHIAARNPRRMSVANRTLARGEALAQRIGGDAFVLSTLPERLREYDIVVTSTASALPIVGLGAVASALKARRHRPMLMVDLAVPRDIEPEVGALDDVYLYTVDDLADVVRQGRAEREQAVVEAERIIDRHTEAYLRWLDARAVVPTIRALRDQAERHRRHELARARRLLARGDDPAQVLEAFSQALTNKLLHAPVSALNQAGADEHATLIGAVRQIYHLHDDP
jgi:glutamyl-tRNA reductase